MNPEPGTPERVDLGRPRRVHIAGIGGTGMSAIATVLQALGHRVTGSDAAESRTVERLRSLGIPVEVGHAGSNLGDAELMALSSAIRPDNPEVLEAHRRGVEVRSRADVLSGLTRLRRTVSVAGTHGKTTTSAMLVVILRQAGWEPSFIVGGEIAGIGWGAAWGPGEWMVVEADESDGTFLDLDTDLAVVTSVEPDHLEHYGGFEPLVEAFGRFLAGARSGRLADGDHHTAREVGRRHSARSFGFDPGVDYRVESYRVVDFGSQFELDHPGGRLPLSVPLPGRHNAANGAAAAAAALEIGVDAEAVQAGLAGFGGVGRRFQRRGEYNGATLVDDYAHLPGEVEPALEAARSGPWSRVVCVFQPHRYSRTAQLSRDFGTSFGAADLVLVTDVYASSESPIPGVSGQLVVDAIRHQDPARAVEYIPDRGELVDRLRRILGPGDLCLTLGAGDLTQVPDQIVGGGP